VVSAGAAKTIDGAASTILGQWAALRVVTDGTQWLILSGPAAPAVANSIVFGG
jgi:hypothetical protein